MISGRMIVSIKKLGLLTLCIVLHTFSTRLSAQQQGEKTFNRPATNAELISTSEKFFSERMANDGIVGLSVALIVEGKVIWQKGFGYADRENKIPMTEHTVVNIGSITKTFTALSVLQLQEKGLINIDNPLVNYLPQFSPKSRPGITPNAITVKSVITHTSGIQSDIWKNSDLNSGKYTDVLGYVNNTYLTYPAGMVGLYSNAGYNILGHLVKQVSKEDYSAYVHNHIFKPLNMTHSGFATDTLKERAMLYAGGQLIATHELRDIASGGIYTDMVDFSKYAIGLLNAYQGKKQPGKFLTGRETIRKMFTLQNRDVPLESNKKGLGWFMFQNDSALALYHAGSAGFAQAKLLLFPEKNAAAIVMTNTAEGGRAAEEFCFNLLPRYGLSIPDLFPPPVTGPLHDSTNATKLSENELRSYTGNYAESNTYHTITIKNGYLEMQDEDGHFILRNTDKNEFIPYRITNNDTVALKNTLRLFFKDIQGYHFLFRRTKNREYNMGYRLKAVDTTTWSRRYGHYEQYGYQMLIGDSKFKSVDLRLSADGVLMLTLKTLGSTNDIPLDVIDKHCALSCGINAGFGGFNVKFYEDEQYLVVDFAGITFRKLRGQKQ